MPTVVKIKEFIRTQIMTVESIEGSDNSNACDKQPLADHTSKGNKEQINPLVNLLFTLCFKILLSLPLNV